MKTRSTLDLIKDLKKVSTIKETDVLSDSKYFSEDFLTTTTTDTPMMNATLSGSLDGGLRSGLLTIAAPSKHFKTSFALYMASCYLKQHKDSVMIFYTCEFGSPKEYFETFGIDLDRVLVTPITTIEEWKTDITNQLENIEEKDNVIIVVDSIGNLATKKSTADALGGKDTTDMTRSKVLKSLFTLITPKLTMKNTPMIAIAHTYKEMSLYPKDVVGGGNGPIYSSNDIWIVGRQQDKEGGELTGYNFIIKIEKSRFTREGLKVPITVKFDGGICKYSGLLENALESGHVIKPANGWYQKVDTETGEVFEKKYREKETHDDDFWKDILSNDGFKSFIKHKYKLISKSKQLEQEIIKND